MFICTWHEVVDFLGAVHLNSKKSRFDSVSAGIGLVRSLSAWVIYKALCFQIKGPTLTLKQHFGKKILELEDEKRTVQVHLKR